MESKVACDFCGRTNTKWEDVYEGGGLFSSARKVGRKEVIIHSHNFFRCPSCGRFYCENCIQKKFTEGSAVSLPFSVATFGAVDVMKKVCMKCGDKLKKNTIIMKWLSINQVNQLIKNKLYEIESGKIFERGSGREVGSISNGRFNQNSSYSPPKYITDNLETFDNDWNNSDKTW